MCRERPGRVRSRYDRTVSVAVRYPVVSVYSRLSDGYVPAGLRPGTRRGVVWGIVWWAPCWAVGCSSIGPHQLTRREQSRRASKGLGAGRCGSAQRSGPQPLPTVRGLGGSVTSGGRWSCGTRQAGTAGTLANGGNERTPERPAHQRERRGTRRTRPGAARHNRSKGHGPRWGGQERRSAAGGLTRGGGWACAWPNQLPGDSAARDCPWRAEGELGPDPCGAVEHQPRANLAMHKPRPVAGIAAA